MNFDDLIRFKALHLKFVASGSNVAELLADGKMEHTIPMKNVCAMITQELFDDLTNTCGLLDISKRTFIEAAIVEALAKAQNIMDGEGLGEYLAERSMERAMMFKES
jgi:hypothetical protein